MWREERAGSERRKGWGRVRTSAAAAIFISPSCAADTTMSLLTRPRPLTKQVSGRQAAATIKSWQLHTLKSFRAASFAASRNFWRLGKRPSLARRRPGGRFFFSLSGHPRSSGQQPGFVSRASLLMRAPQRGAPLVETRDDLAHKHTRRDWLQKGRAQKKIASSPSLSLALAAGKTRSTAKKKSPTPHLRKRRPQGRFFVPLFSASTAQTCAWPR